MNKRLFVSAIMVISGITLLTAQNNDNSVIDAIMSAYSVKTFSTTPVTDKDIDIIVKCGMKAQSARNLQPWKFTVVKDQSLTKEIMPDITSGNVLIIISGQNQKDGVPNYFDCGQATANMFLAAHALSLGAHIYGRPVSVLETGYKERLGIPADYKVVMVMRIGSVDKNVDAVSGASTRKSREDVVNIR